MSQLVLEFVRAARLAAARLIRSNEAIAEALRFGVIGLKSNAIYYSLYVILTMTGMKPKIAVTIVYIFGIGYTFWFNKNFVFRNKKSLNWQFVRYTIVYLLAWLSNIALLDIATMKIGLNHFLAQALLGLLLSGVIFLALKYCVFPPGSPKSR